MSNNNRRHRPRFKNNTPRRQSRMVLIMGDGESERVYFERLSDLCVSVGIKACATAKTGPDVLIRKTREYAKKHNLDPLNGDIVAIVMDLDGRFTKEQICDMDERCKELGYRLFISNPSFESWLLCHFRMPTHPYTPAELVEDLDRELDGAYSKSKGFDISDKMVDKAVGNARKLLSDEACTSYGCYRCNPSTMVHTLVEDIRRRMSKRSSIRHPRLRLRRYDPCAPSRPPERTPGCPRAGIPASRRSPPGSRTLSPGPSRSLSSTG